MADIAGFINGLNQFTQAVGAVQGATQALAPAVHAVDQTVNQIAGVFTGDQYSGPYYPPTYPVYPPMPVGFNEEGKMGVIGNMLAGGVAGAVTHKQAAESITAIKGGQAGAWKSLGMTSLKAGAIGAGVTGVISIAKNMNLVSKGLQSSADAAGNITADTVGGLLAGASGGVAAGAAGLALSGMGVAGLGLTVGAVAAGAVGAAASNLLFKGVGIRDGIANGVRNMMGGQPQYQDPYAYQGYNQGYNYAR